MKSTTGQLDLFDVPAAADTRAEARQRIALSVHHLQGRVLEHIVKCGAAGSTDEETAAGLGMALNTSRPRRNELAKMKLVVDSGRRRPTATGRGAIVWVATSAARLPSAAPPAAAPGPAAKRPDQAAASTRPGPATGASTAPRTEAASADGRPTRPCYCCGGRAFWSHRLSPSTWLCANCRRPVDESHVADRFSLEPGNQQ